MERKLQVQVLDFSGMFARERALFPEPDRFDFEVWDFTHLGETMCFCSEDSARQIRQRIAERSSPEAPSGRRVRWIDTGDYHYLTYFFLERQDRPFTLVLVDHHPDDQPSVFGEDILSCGGWVRTAGERLPLMEEVVHISGDAPADLTSKDFAGGRIYLSIDKDVLSRDDARTDWSQGEMRLERLLSILDLFRGADLAGVDICGGCTEAKGATQEDFAVNARTDDALLKKLELIFT